MLLGRKGSRRFRTQRNSLPSAFVTDASVFAEETLKYDSVILVHVFRSVEKRRVRLLDLAFQLLDGW